MKRYWISSLFFLFVSAGLFFCLNWLDQSLARKELQTKFTQKQIIMDKGKPDVEDVESAFQNSIVKRKDDPAKESMDNF